MIKHSGILNRELTAISKINLVFSKFRRRLVKGGPLLPEGEGATASLPQHGEIISVEEALNSRCSSDYDGRQRTAHWGLLDSSKKLSEVDLERIAAFSSTPGYTSRKSRIDIDGDNLIFLVDQEIVGVERDWLTIESGMRQQAILLACSALGVGASIFGQDHRGPVASDRWLATVRIRLRPMKPSYSDSYWTDSPPNCGQKWQTGNMPDPIRAGTMPLISALKSMSLQKPAGGTVSRGSLGQLLWAGRGRTPHYYNSIPWGLTVPTCGGRQDVSRLDVIDKGHLYSYRNWQKRRPTHSLIATKPLDEACFRELGRLHPGRDCFVIISAKDSAAMNWLEVGYQLLNILLQAQALDLGYESVLLSESQREFISEGLGLHHAGALVAVRSGDPFSR